MWICRCAARLPRPGPFVAATADATNRSAAHAHVRYANRPAYHSPPSDDGGATCRYAPGTVDASSTDDSVRLGHGSHHHEQENKAERQILHFGPPLEPNLSMRRTRLDALRTSYAQVGERPKSQGARGNTLALLLVRLGRLHRQFDLLVETSYVKAGSRTALPA